MRRIDNYCYFSSSVVNYEGCSLGSFFMETQLDKFLSLRNYDGKKFLADSAVLIILGWVLLWVSGIINNLKFYPSFISNAPEPIKVIAWLFFLFMFFMVIKPFYHYLKCLFFSIFPWSKTADFNFAPPSNAKNLIYQGRIELLADNSIFSTNSESGYLFKKMWWKDFLITFKFKFDSTEISVVRGVFDIAKGIEDMLHYFNFIGIIFRAQSLEDYFMISIGVLKNRIDYEALQNKKILDVVITPHIRLAGKWERFGGQGLNTKIKIDDFTQVRCFVKGTEAVIEINGKSLKWNLPTNFDKVVIDSVEKESYEPARLSSTNSTKIPFRTSFGMIGFRTSGAEHAIVKDVNIKRQ